MAPVQSKMDPWAVTRTNEENSGQVTTAEACGNVELSFNDHFAPFEKLPDSSEYLASLEKKLEKIQRGSVKDNKLSSNAVIHSLQETRKSYMVQLLSDSMNQVSEADTMDELKVNPILKKLAPEKQPIALEELVHLVKADQLALPSDEDASPEDENETPELLTSSPHNEIESPPSPPPTEQ